MLFDESKSPEFTFKTIVEAMMIAVQGNESRADDVITSLNLFNYVYGKWQFRDPWGACCLILQVELRGSGVCQVCHLAHIIVDRLQQVRLLPSHQIDISHGLADIVWQR